MPVVNGWTVRAHPLLLDQLERLTVSVETLKRRHPDTYRLSANAKLLAALLALMFDRIPRDPAAAAYLQGNTLGSGRRHWFRAKFGAGRFRLFFRYSSQAKVIIYAWVNDDDSLRTYGARTDAYAVFRGMLEGGNPPDDWDTLLAAVSERRAEARLAGARAAAVQDDAG